MFLQGLREATGGIFNELFNAISKIVVDVMFYLPFVVFWACDKKWEYRFLFTLIGGNALNGTVKSTACAYRPWIRSSLIEPAGDSKIAATGYSFPSGHTLYGTTIYGTLLVWQKNKRRWLAILCALAIFLTGFSRNFLGVHTPQDVAVGFLIGLLTIFVAGKLSALSENVHLMDALTLAGLVLVALSIVYVEQKPYPMDYVNGVLLVDPQKMMIDHFKATGALAGLLAGSFIERHFWRYEIPLESRNLTVLTCTGLGILFCWKEYLANATLVLLLGNHWGYFVARFLLLFFAVCIWPRVISKRA